MPECPDCDGLGCPSCSPDECEAEALAAAMDDAENDHEQSQILSWKCGERSAR